MPAIGLLKLCQFHVAEVWEVSQIAIRIHLSHPMPGSSRSRRQGNCHILHAKVRDDHKDGVPDNDCQVLAILVVSLNLPCMAQKRRKNCTGDVSVSVECNPAEKTH